MAVVEQLPPPAPTSPIDDRAARKPRRIPAWLPAVAFAGAIAVLMSLPFVMQLQADSYKALYDGRWIVEHGLPHHEALTIMSRGRSWIDEQWLSDVAFYEAWRLGGDGMVALLSLAGAASAYMILAHLMSRRSARLSVVVGCVTLGIVTLSGWQFPRAQDLALPLFATLLTICLTDSRHARPQVRLAALLPLLAVWANVHGSVLLGALLASGYLAYRAVRSARAGLRRPAVACAALAVGALLTPLATPYGPGIVDYYREFTGNPAMARMAAEWSRARVGSLAFFELCIPALLTLIAVTFAARRRSWPHIALLGAVAITAVAAFMESGSIVWFGMTAAVLAADCSHGGRSSARTGVPAAVALTVVAAAACALVVCKVAARPDTSYESQVAPRVIVAATAYAAQHPCASVLADNLSASALLWHSPQLAGRIAFDARLEQYRPSGLSRFATYVSGRGSGWPATTAGFRVLIGQSDYAPALVDRLVHLSDSSVLLRTSDSVVVLNHASGRSPAGCVMPGGAA